MPPTPGLSRAVLYGRKQPYTTWAVTIAGGFFVLSYFFWAIPGVSATASELLPVDVIGTSLTLLVLLTGVHAYWNRGLVINWLLVFFPVLGATLNFVGVGLQTPGIERLGLTLALPVLTALLLGTTGYLLGRRLHHIFGSPHAPNPH